MSSRLPTSRREALKNLGAVTALVGGSTVSAKQTHDDTAQAAAANTCNWAQLHNRVWLGQDFWANPMEDWCIRDGAAECLSQAGGRNVHWITKRIDRPERGFTTSVVVQMLDTGKTDDGAGFRVGVRSDIDEHRSNSFANGGIQAGIVNGQLMLRKKSVELAYDAAEKVKLMLTAEPETDSDQPEIARVRLSLQAYAMDGSLLASTSTMMAAKELVGNICIANGFPGRNKGPGSRFRFEDWQLSGEGIATNADNVFGPILWTMYTLSNSRSDEGFVLKLSALTPPLASEDNHTVELEVEEGGNWASIATATIDQDAWTGVFRVANWNANKEVAFRVSYKHTYRSASPESFYFEGRIQPNPVGRPLRMAALTCQNHYGFPYAPVADNVKNLAPDLIYFSGDQLYESHGGFGIIREPADRAILNYLRKFYMFGWAFRDCMRNSPTICIPDDHDVFQGNIWGEGGAPMEGLENGASSKGGYREPARMVNVVHRTNAAHHPAPFDGRPALQGISVYYGELVYGDVGFAILADRQFKSGPERVETGSGRADHVLDPSFDTQQLDRPGLILLGERQEAFLQQWARDWRGHSMKVVLSQTVFAGVATHHGKFDGYLKADLDSGAWPQTPRNNAIDILRPAMPLHINGDQHLASLCQYGVRQQRDSFWSFCTPAIAAGYPRWWRPEEVGMPHENRPAHGLSNTGEYVDGFGNLVYVYAVGNPDVGTRKNRYELAHQKGSGFGFVTIDTEKRTYYIEAFRFLADLNDENENSQFPGWPLTLHQQENRGINLIR